MNEDRVILHCDCNNFFASVETVLNPAYRGVPMAVCGSEDDRHGIVLAKNQLAKKYHIETAETVWSARRKCPNLVIVPPHYEAYAAFSRRINEIYDTYTDMVEPFSIDESFLDVTGSRALFGDGVTIADEIRERVKRETGVTISVGVSFNKIFAKMGSDYKKPDAVTVISRENFRTLLYPLPVGSMMYVGGQTEAQLAACGIRTIGQLAAASPSFLSARLGRLGGVIQAYAQGLDDSPVLRRGESGPPKSVGNGMTFRRDLVDEGEIRVALEALCEEVGARLRDSGQYAATLSVSIKDTLLHTISRQAPLPRPTSLSRELAVTAMQIFRRGWNLGRPVRALTVTAMHLTPAEACAEQLTLFSEESDRRREKNTHLEQTVDRIRTRYGHAAISSGAVLGSDFGLPARAGWKKTEKNPKKEQKNGKSD